MSSSTFMQRSSISVRGYDFFVLIKTDKLVKPLTKVRLPAKGVLFLYRLVLQIGTHFVFASSLPAERGQLHHSI